MMMTQTEITIVVVIDSLPLKFTELYSGQGMSEEHVCAPVQNFPQGGRAGEQRAKKA